MKNIHVLPTDKPSRLFKLAGDLHLHEECEIDPKRNQNIYITSDEEIKEGDWVFDFYLRKNTILKSKKKYTKNNIWYYKKIILTTDQDLIKAGVQAIDDEFLEWFVKNPSCESVEIKSWIKTYEDGSSFDRMDYKIIISKEEPKQATKNRILSETSEETIQKAIDYGNSLVKETLEEAIRKEYKFRIGSHSFSNPLNIGGQQERMYSEEDLRESFIEGYKQRAEKSDLIFDNASRMYAIHLFEQFKKK